MSAPCPECKGSGWIPYSVETLDGGEEWAWRLCTCGEGKWGMPVAMLEGKLPRQIESERDERHASPERKDN